jgi:DNA-binding transcriptional ArsR family regulator
MDTMYVEERELVSHRLRAEVAPLPSLLLAATDAARTERSGTPDAWRRVIRAHLTRRDHEALAPLAAPKPACIPSSLIVLGPTFEGAVEQLVAAADVLAGEIHGLDGVWREPARDPRRWLCALLVALTHAWSAFQPVWRAGQARLAAERERVHAGAERGAHLLLLADLVPYGHAGGGRWTVEDEDVRLGVPENGVTLVPLLTGGSLLDDDGGVLRLVGYGLPARRNGEPAALEALLGIPRARILRALERPATNNHLAAVLQTVPSAATHHVSALVAAGLAVRDRTNGSLLVRRTSRGDALLALYE